MQRGYLFFNLEDRTDRRKIAEDIVRLGNGYVPAVEFLKNKYFDARVLFDTRDRKEAMELSDKLKKHKGIKRDSVKILYTNNWDLMNNIGLTSLNF